MFKKQFMAHLVYPKKAEENSSAFLLPFYQQRRYPLFIRRDYRRFKSVVNHFAGFGTGRFLYIFDDGIIHRNQRRIPGSAVVSGDDCRLLQCAVGNLLSVRYHDSVRARNLLRMEPHIIIMGLFQRQPVILNIIPAYQNGKPIGRAIFQRQEFFRLFIFLSRLCRLVFFLTD